MPPPDDGDKTHFEAETARLRAKGYPDDLIQRILIEQENAASQHQQGGGAGATPPHGPMTGVLGNIGAVLTHTQATIPVIQGELATVSNRKASAWSRLRSAAILAFVAVVVAMLGFAIRQEWQQQIIYETEIKRLNTEIAKLNVDLTTAQNQKMQAEASVAREVAEGQKAQALKAEADAAVAREVAEGQKAQALKAEADAAVAREVAEGQKAQALKAEADAAVAKQLNDAQLQKMQAEAAQAKALNDAQAEKLKAEAEVARQINEAQLRKTRAEECSARMKAAIDTVPMNQLGEATAAITRDCDPRNNISLQCDEKFKAFISSVETLDSKDMHPSDTLLAKANEYKAVCPFGPEQQQATKEALDRRQAKIDKLKALIQKLTEEQEAKKATPPPAPLAAQSPQTAPVEPRALTPAQQPPTEQAAPPSAPTVESTTQTAKEKACVEEFDTLFSRLQQVDKNDTAGFDDIGIQLFVKHKENCPFTSDQIQKLDTMKEQIDASSERIKDMAGLALIQKYIEEEKKAFAAGDYDTAYNFSKQRADLVEEMETKKKGKAGRLTAVTLGNLAWAALFAHKYQEALDAADRSIALDPSDLVPVGNRAHALMFLGRAEEAKAVYLAHKGEPLQGKKWEDVVADDFAALRKAGLGNPLMDEVAHALSPPEPAPAPVEPRALTPAPPPVAEPQQRQLRTPTLFNCSRENLGVDYVICASPELLDAEARLEDAYNAALAARGNSVKMEQREWIRRYGPDCGLPAIGQPADDQIQSAAGCVRSATESRIGELQTELSRPQLRTPAMFNCSRAKLGVDFVVCASPELMDRMAQLEDAYNGALAAKGNSVKMEQREWIRRYGPDCGLPAIGQPPDDQLQSTAGCVRSALENRISELHAEQ